MRKHSKISYCPLLLAGILTAGALTMATGTSHARYTTVASGSLQLRQEETAVTLTSDVLAPGGQTVELGSLGLSESMEIAVNLKAEGGTAAGALLFEENDYLTASCYDTIDGDAGTFRVTLTPTAMAQELPGGMTTTLRVSWDEDLWADLRVTLAPDETTDLEPQADTAEGNFLTGMAEFDPNALLALRIAVPEGSDCVILRELPALTRYSTDGKNFTLLYHGGSAELTPEGQNITVLLDFGNAQTGEQDLTLTAEAYGQGIPIEKADFTTKPGAVLMKNDEISAPVIVGENALNLGLPTNLGGAELYYTLTRPNGTTDNMPLIADVDGSLVIDPMNNGVQAPAGTYLLEVNWDYQGATVETRKLTFFINYCSYVQPSSIPAADDSTEATTTGGNES